MAHGDRRRQRGRPVPGPLSGAKGPDRAAAREEAVAALLANERARTLARISALTRDFDRIVEEAAIGSTDDEHDPEGATLAFERAQVAALRDQARTHLAALDEAESRLAAGVYGACVVCGGLIPLERLRARPTATTCVGCA